MAKKGFGKFMALATIAGAAAVGISYLKKYKSFNQELEEEFHDFEGDDKDFFDDEEEDPDDGFKDGPFPADDSEFEDDDEALPFNSDEPEDTEETDDKRKSRKYISLHADAYDVKLAAKDILAAAGGMADAAKNVLKDTAVILTDTAYEAASAAKDAAQIARVKLGEKADSYRERQAARKEAGNKASEGTGNHDKEDAGNQPGEENAQDIQPGSEKSSSMPEAGKEPPAAGAEDIIIEAEDTDGTLKPEPLPKESTPEPISGSAKLDTEPTDSTLEAIKPEDAGKSVPDSEATTIVEEIE